MTGRPPDCPTPEAGPPPERSWVMGRSARWQPPPGGGAGLYDQREHAFQAREALEWASTADPRTLHGCLTLCELLFDLLRKLRRSSR